MKIRSSVILSLITVTLLVMLTVLPALAATPIYVRPGGDDTNCDGTVDVDYSIGVTACAVQTIQRGIDLVDPSGTVYVRAGTYVLSAAVNVNKTGITLDGDGVGATIVQVSGTGDRFSIAASGVTVQDFEIVKTDKTGPQEIIRIANGNNVAIRNNTIHGQFVIGDGDVSRAIVVNAGAFNGLNIEGNTIYALRQPAYISGSHTGTVQNNYVYGTKGWVLEGGNLTFTGNTWGTGANANVYDIAILSLVGAGPYPDIVAMSNANNGAVIEDQRVSPAVLSAVYVDAGTAYTTDLGGRYHPYSTITPAVTRVVSGGTINVAAGTYDEDVNLSKSLSLLGAGAGSTTIRGVIGGDSATVRVSASNVTVAGFTITRLGNNTIDWNNPGLNSIGIAVQGTSLTGMIVRDNTITGNRNGIDINNSSGHTIRNNVITDNRTGMILRNQTDNLAVIENEITNNWTMGILFLDASGGTNIPVQTALNCTFSNNNLSGNWYGQIVERQAGGSLPLPGTTNLKNFSGNWFGTTAPVITTTNSTEPGYSVQIPVEYGGTAVAPGDQPDILGPASANFDFTPYLNSGTDTNVETTLGRGTNGFQGDFSNLWVTAISAQVGTTGRIQEGINIASTTTVNVMAGTYVEDLTINKAVTLLGPNAAINPNTGTRVAEAVILPAVSAPDPSVCEVMAYLSVSNITLRGFTFDGDNPSLTSGIMIGTADVDACEILAGYEGMGNITVENNILKHSTYSGIDFYNYTNTAATSGNYIRYNRFEGIGETTYNWGMGVLIYNNFYADITNNVFIGVRTGIQTGNFSAANPGTTGSISNNTIGTWRVGIFHNLAYGSASALTLANNTITAETYPGATKWNGILLSSIGGAVTATVSGNTIVIPGTVSYPAPGYTAGYNVWSVTTSAPITISGGTVTGGDYGVWVNNYAGYTSNANNTAITIAGVNIANAARAGIFVQDDPLNTNGATVHATIQNSTINDSAVGILIEGSDATATAHLNRITGNIVGVNNTTGIILPFDRNYWGTVDESGVAAAATSNVDYQPWCNADFTNCSYYPTGTISMQTSGTPAAIGEIITMDSLVTADGVYGMQLRVSFDPTGLEFQTTGSSHNDIAAAGWYWDFVQENFVAVSGGRRLSGAMTNDLHSIPATLTGQSVATWKFKCLKIGTFNLTYDTTASAGTYLATKDGFGIPANLTSVDVTCGGYTLYMPLIYRNN